MAPTGPSPGRGRQPGHDGAAGRLAKGGWRSPDPGSNLTLRDPPSRLRTLEDRPIRPEGDHVLYWMVAARRTRHSFALAHAAARAAELGKPLVVLEALRAGHRWASDRLHAFVLEGMADNARAFADRGVAYHPYLEPEPGAGRGLLAALAERACSVVTDDAPFYFLPGMVAAAAERLPVRLELVDGNGLLPLARLAPRCGTGRCTSAGTSSSASRAISSRGRPPTRGTSSIFRG